MDYSIRGSGRYGMLRVSLVFPGKERPSKRRVARHYLRSGPPGHAMVSPESTRSGPSDQTLAWSFLGGSAGDQIPQPVPALLVTLVEPTCGAHRAPGLAGVAVRRPP